jgi:recombination protein RecR
MNIIEKLTGVFSRFPGIGPRQAKRFVFFLLTQNSKWLDELINGISKLQESVTSCISCQMFFQKNDSNLCNICSNLKRDKSLLMIVERDTDIEAIEKSNIYNGFYFILGNSINILEKKPGEVIRSNKLMSLINQKIKDGLQEIILSLSLKPDSENTEMFLREKLSVYQNKYNIKISKLGRGLSTGMELEYSDSETLKSALDNRKTML